MADLARDLAGALDPGSEIVARLPQSLSPRACRVLRSADLAVAYTGPPAQRGDLLCLLSGQLDNVDELRAELDIGPECSEEQLLGAAWRRWREDLVQLLRGDFALLIWDSLNREGLVARDQLGIRSMFLSEMASCLTFATEIRNLLALLPRRPDPDPVGIAHWIGMTGRPGAGTLYRGVRRLEPGCMLVLRGNAAVERRYWAPSYRRPLDAPGSELALRVRETIGQAVRRRLARSGRTGVMLSGGLDSASVAAHVTALTSDAPAYSATFPEHPEIDESALIAQLRDDLAMPGTTAVVRSGGMLQSAVDTALDWQLPLASWGDVWAVPLLHAAAAAGVGTILGGDGGDEQFGARFWLLADVLRAGRPIGALKLARELPGIGDRPSARVLAGAVLDFGVTGALAYARHEPIRRLRARRSMPSWMRPPTAAALIESADPFAWKRVNGPRWWSSAAQTLTRGVEEAGLFEEHRHRAAAAGVVARHPLYDLDVLELALALPPRLTYDRHRDRPLMRASMVGLLPDAVRLRPRKARFDSLLVDSLAGSDRAGIVRLLGDRSAELGAYIDLDALRALLPSGDPAELFSAQWVQQLWRLASLECWLRAQRGDGDALSEIPRTQCAVSLESIGLRSRLGTRSPVKTG